MPMFKYNTDWVLLLVIVFSKHSKLCMEHSEKNIVLSVFLFYIYKMNIMAQLNKKDLFGWKYQIPVED